MKAFIFLSGRGSNAENICHAVASGFLPLDIKGIVSNNKNSKALNSEWIKDYPTFVFSAKQQEFEEQALSLCHKENPNIIILAGFMRILSENFISKSGCPIVNIHPSLLPDFPGLNAPEQQLKAGRNIVGATVHIVDAGVDTGPIILQESLVFDKESHLSIHEQIIKIEHRLYPKALKLFIERLHK